MIDIYATALEELSKGYRWQVASRVEGLIGGFRTRDAARRAINEMDEWQHTLSIGRFFIIDLEQVVDYCNLHGCQLRRLENEYCP